MGPWQMPDLTHRWSCTTSKLRRVTLDICESCMEGAGGECHVPGCAFWMRKAPEWPFFAAMTPEEFNERYG
jgi:hypothetical protein